MYQSILFHFSSLSIVPDTPTTFVYIPLVKTSTHNYTVHSLGAGTNIAVYYRHEFLYCIQIAEDYVHVATKMG